jgi:hypothetical protein
MSGRLAMVAGAWYVYHHIKGFKESSALTAKEAVD